MPRRGRVLTELEPLAQVVRGEWGRLLALLAARYRRLDLAEDALGDAVEAAARTWPRDGVPDQPHRLADDRRPPPGARPAARRGGRRPHAARPGRRGRPDRGGPTRHGRRHPPGERGVDDERLRLVLLCAHPALAPDAAAALTLRLVLGVPTADIARLFLVPTADHGGPADAGPQARRGRAVRRARPAPSCAAGSAAVADIAYLAFTAGYAPGSGADVLRAEEAGEALRLVRVLRELRRPDRADLDALLALMLLQHARRDARVHDGELVLLPDQDRAPLAPRRDRRGARAADAAGDRRAVDALPAPGADRRPSTRSPRPPPTPTGRRIAGWYAELEELTGSPVVRLNRAVAVAEADGPDAGLRLLDGLDLPGHRLPAARAELLRRAGREAEALAAYDVAIGLCGNDAERRHLVSRAAALRSP